MGLFNMEETWLIRLVSTNIQWLVFLCCGLKLKLTWFYYGIAPAF